MRRLDRGHPAHQWQSLGETLDTANSPKPLFAPINPFLLTSKHLPPPPSLFASIPPRLRTPPYPTTQGGQDQALPLVSPEEGMRQAAEWFPARHCQWELLGCREQGRMYPELSVSWQIRPTPPAGCYESRSYLHVSSEGAEERLGCLCQGKITSPSVYNPPAPPGLRAGG